MDITEILITGYDGDNEVFVASLTNDRARTIFTVADADGQSTVESVKEVNTEALATVMRLFEDAGIVRRPESAGVTR